MSGAPPRTEAAFTLLEMIVAMVLLAIAMGMVGSAIIQALSGTTSSTSGAMSDTTIARVVARFQDDLAVAETSDRAAGLVREQSSLDAALQRNADAPSDNPGVWKASVDLEDVVEATSTRFVIQADVDRRTAGVECVTWEALASGQGSSIARTVRRTAPGCLPGGAVIKTEVLLRSDARARGAVPEPFSYDLLCNRTLCTGAPPAAPGSECAPWTVPNVGAGNAARQGLRRVVAVRATFVTNSGRNAVQGRSATAMSIRSRDEHMWRTALGC